MQLKASEHVPLQAVSSQFALAKWFSSGSGGSGGGQVGETAAAPPSGDRSAFPCFTPDPSVYLSVSSKSHKGQWSQGGETLQGNKDLQQPVRVVPREAGKMLSRCHLNLPPKRKKRKPVIILNPLIAPDERKRNV